MDAVAEDVADTGGGPASILLAIDTLDIGGAERYVVDLARALAARGTEVSVACSQAGPLADDLAAAGVPVAALGSTRVKRRVSLSYARALGQLIRSAPVDLVHAHLYATEAAAALSGAGAGVPIVLTDHTEGPWRRAHARAISRRVYRRAARIMAVSEPIRRMIIEGYGIASERVVYVPNAVVARPPGTEPPLPPGFAGRRLIARVARLEPEKGIDVFLRAIAGLGDRFPDVRWLVIGDGPLRVPLEDEAARLRVDDRVAFLGFRADCRDIVARVEALAITSITDGAPLAILEAMMEGVPVVGSATGGIPGQIRHGTDGLLVPAGDPTALGDALASILERPAWARSLGRAGRRRVEAHCAHAAMIDRIVAVYRDAERERRVARAAAAIETAMPLTARPPERAVG